MFSTLMSHTHFNEFKLASKFENRGGLLHWSMKKEVILSLISWSSKKIANFFTKSLLACPKVSKVKFQFIYVKQSTLIIFLRDSKSYIIWVYPKPTLSTSFLLGYVLELDGPCNFPISHLFLRLYRKFVSLFVVNLKHSFNQNWMSYGLLSPSLFLLCA